MVNYYMQCVTKEVNMCHVSKVAYIHEGRSYLLSCRRNSPRKECGRTQFGPTNHNYMLQSRMGEAREDLPSLKGNAKQDIDP